MRYLVALCALCGAAWAADLTVTQAGNSATVTVVADTSYALQTVQSMAQDGKSAEEINLTFAQMRIDTAIRRLGEEVVAIQSKLQALHTVQEPKPEPQSSVNIGSALVEAAKAAKAAVKALPVEPPPAK